MYWQANPFCQTAPTLHDLYVECCRLGLADGSSDGALRFATGAACALRQGAEPAKLFATMVNTGQMRQGGELKYAIQDEEAALSMMRGRAGPQPSAAAQRREFGD
jgi:hypothetical protein